MFVFFNFSSRKKKMLRRRSKPKTDLNFRGETLTSKSLKENRLKKRRKKMLKNNNNNNNNNSSNSSNNNHNHSFNKNRLFNNNSNIINRLLNYNNIFKEMKTVTEGAEPAAI